MLIDEDPIIRRIEGILDRHVCHVRTCVEWSDTLYGVQVLRLGLEDHLAYRVCVFDGLNTAIYMRSTATSATWIECPHPDIERGWWRLSACGVEFLDGVLAAALDWVVVE